MRNLKLLSILFLGMILLFAACKKEDDKEDTTPPVVESNGLIKSYLFNGIKHEFEYDEYKKLIKIKFSDLGSVEGTTVYFEYSGNKLLRWVGYSDGELIAKVMFSDHNAYDLPTKGEVYIAEDGPLELVQAYTYIYTDDKMTELLVSEVDEGQETLANKDEYIYTDGNVVTQNIYESYFGSLILTKTISFTFDDKNNPAFSFGFINFAEDELFQGMSVMDINNYTVMEVKDADGNLKQWNSYNRVFEYNANDNPTKCIMTSFDGNEVINLEYEYY